MNCQPKRDVIYSHADFYALSYEIRQDVHSTSKIAKLSHIERRLTVSLLG
jgi:hypothetical protein